MPVPIGRRLRPDEEHASHEVPGSGVAIGTGAGSLAATGANATWWIAAALVLLVAGGLLLRTTRRREAAHESR
ncbi:LPXTG cell wall anchor domain-containing protein [Umezawaea sp. Da 62-37]|uniref:LPXTG cell wall anchor domain-containing protein n=1 Tax=Umezawaea sp. Da 62-37 TaxID=3075927 RepID=UPI0028F6CFED|nr:LPXTG cell wall anchor domain-containing protein [Umezawaea sp. Da 62-37]WNV82728.1 LPXTG cell wall anchor domain-containing protein [Umezawaea sp. Da 62-37]